MGILKDIVSTLEKGKQLYDAEVAAKKRRKVVGFVTLIGIPTVCLATTLGLIGGMKYAGDPVYGSLKGAALGIILGIVFTALLYSVEALTHIEDEDVLAKFLHDTQYDNSTIFIAGFIAGIILGVLLASLIGFFMASGDNLFYLLSCGFSVAALGIFLGSFLVRRRIAFAKSKEMEKTLEPMTAYLLEAHSWASNRGLITHKQAFKSTS